jgi:hypothetical protein
MRVIERTMFYGVLNDVFIDLKKIFEQTES